MARIDELRDVVNKADKIVAGLAKYFPKEDLSTESPFMMNVPVRARDIAQYLEARSHLERRG